MATVLAVLLALLSSTLFAGVFGFVVGILNAGIYETTGIVWLPVLIVIAMSGAGMFAGMVIALRLIKSADLSKTFFGVAVLISLLAGMSIMGHLFKQETHMLKDVLVSLLSLVSMLIGAKVGSMNARDE